MSCGFGGKVYGFTKHGSGKFKLTRRHDPNYDREKFIEYASDNVAVIRCAEGKGVGQRGCWLVVRVCKGGMKRGLLRRQMVWRIVEVISG